jgi:hypothetical protein
MTRPFSHAMTGVGPLLRCLDRAAGSLSGLLALLGIPLGMIFGVFFLPAWLLVAIGRLPRFTTVFGLCGLIAFAVVWAQLLTEFPKAQLY